MNYDRRYSPPGGFGYPTQTRSQQPTPRGIDSRSQFYGREYPPLRSRSQNNIEQDYERGYPPQGGQQQQHQQPFYDSRTLDRTARSKSLDTREFRGDDGYYRDDYPPGGVIIPIKRETGPRRTFDPRNSPPRQQREPQHFEENPGEIHIPYNHRETPRRSVDERQRFGGFDSPKSHSSRYPPQEPRHFEEYPRGREIDPGFQLQPYRMSGGGGGGGGGYRSSSSHHRSHHETFEQPRVITQQPQDPRFNNNFNQGPSFGPGQGGPRPIQHHRVQCCCFRFVWPPWSVEQAAPPQQIYRNI